VLHIVLEQGPTAIGHNLSLEFHVVI